ncbi:DUF3306 domain-containing protein [Antarcticimicrobium luteum]|uniref:DUF3306 domain-containing protein n=1 Tax=Antarcticimicrobium luteum TaxID=2547397 RepID=A0A4R5VCX9_9RHOB|nr:DUF3306 domain-containing protein [Antarcticimicrobium luteum]TDK50169.1 DUF3306 domain-containing protein [Antarcticimicrobium luteum]
MAVARETGDFWSRRRAAVRAEAEAEAAAQRAAEAARDEQERARAAAEKTDEDLLEELGLPDPDGLKPGDDFAAFMQKTVPERLRRRALRRLWTSNPILANLDGLTDYSDDFTDAATVIPDMRTAYQVGRGMYQHVRTLVSDTEEEAGDAADAAASEEAGPEQAGGDAPALAAADPSAPRLRETDAQALPPVEEMEEEPEPAPLTRRHMRFAFES